MGRKQMKTEFFKPTNVKETTALLEKYQDKAVIINGGSDIVEKISSGKIKLEAIVYIADIEELSKISERNGNIVIGGSVTYIQMLNSPVIHKVKGLIEAVRQLGSPGIRQVATPAGNIGTGAPSADCITMLMGLETKLVLVSEAE